MSNPSSASQGEKLGWLPGDDPFKWPHGYVELQDTGTCGVQIDSDGTRCLRAEAVAVHASSKPSASQGGLDLEMLEQRIVRSLPTSNRTAPIEYEEALALISRVRELEEALNGCCACGAKFDAIIVDHQANFGCYPKGHTPGMFPSAEYVAALADSEEGK